MAKRSREDFEPSSSDSDPEGEAQASSLSVVQQSSRARSTATAKIVHLDHHTGGEASSVTEMRCSLPPHRQLSFTSFEEYEVHYNKTHVNRCLECRKNFPTEHFLNLHIQENHDSLNEVRKERGEKTYSCFVEDCDKVCSTAEKRRLHLIDKHTFPRDYDFYVVNDGIDRRSSMLRSGRHRRRSSAQHMADIEGRARRRHSGQKIKDTKESDESDEGESLADASALTPPSSKEDADMDGLTGAMSALKFVPLSIRFGRGRGKGRGGFSKS